MTDISPRACNRMIEWVLASRNMAIRRSQLAQPLWVFMTLIALVAKCVFLRDNCIHATRRRLEPAFCFTAMG